MTVSRYTSLLMLLLLPCMAQAQDYTFTSIDLPVTSGAPGRSIALVGLANDGTMAGDDQSPQGQGSRLSPTLEVSPVICPPGSVERYPLAARLGPEVVAMNNAHTVVGNEEALTAQVGFVQTSDGACTFYLVPGAVGTVLTGIDDHARVVGQYWNDVRVELGLLRFHGFVKEGDTLTLLTSGVSNDVLWPTGINTAGDIIGYAFRDVQPDNSYVYQAFYVRGGSLTWLDGPHGEDVWPTGLNNAGQVTAVLQPQGAIGGPGWLYDTITETWAQIPMPTPATTTMLPRGLNDHGAIVGLYVESFPDAPPFGRTVLQQFLATRTGVADLEPPGAEEPEPRRKTRRHWGKKQRQYVRKHRREGRQEAQTDREHRQPGPRFWRPVLDEDGSVCLTDGEHVIGRRR